MRRVDPTIDRKAASRAASVERIDEALIEHDEWDWNTGDIDFRPRCGVSTQAFDDMIHYVAWVRVRPRHRRSPVRLKPARYIRGEL